MWTKPITLHTPYNFDQVLSRLSMDPLNHIDIEKREVKIPLYTSGRPVIVNVRGTGTFERPEFQLFADSVDEAWAVGRITDIFGWNRDLEAVLTYLKQTSLAPVAERCAYMPFILEFDYFASLIRNIIHQQVNLKFAFTLTERFVKTYGTEVDGVWMYPSPERVAVIPTEELRSLQLSQRKADYMTGLAQAIVEGLLDIHSLRHQTDEEVTAQLLPLKGIGPWTVQSFLMFALGRENMFPKADIGLQRALQKLFGLGEKPDGAFMDKIIEECTPYNSYASLYLWRSIE